MLASRRDRRGGPARDGRGGRRGALPRRLGRGGRPPRSTTVVVGRSLDDVAEATAAARAAARGRGARPGARRGGGHVVDHRPRARARRSDPRRGRDDLCGRPGSPGARAGDGRRGRSGSRTTMNRMLARLEPSQARQRRFVSDAAHELRSPVAAIRQHSRGRDRHPDTTTSGELAEVVHDENLRVERAGRRPAPARSARRGGRRLGRRAGGPRRAGRSRKPRGSRAASHRGRHERRAARVVEGNPSELRRAIGNLVDNAARHARSARRRLVSADAPRRPAHRRRRRAGDPGRRPRPHLRAVRAARRREVARRRRGRARARDRPGDGGGARRRAHA